MDPTQVPLGNGMVGQARDQLAGRGQMLQLQERAALGDPEAIAQLQQMQAQQQGGRPPGQPGMSQSEFGNGGAPVPPDVQARRAKQLIELLRAQGR
jgi:hypothetical protein